MTERRLCWLRLCVTLLAVTCMVARAVMPAAAETYGARGLAGDLKVLGAALCHSGERDDGQVPANAPACDHCPVCATGVHTPFALTVAAVAPVPPALTEPLPSAGRDARASPRGPPEYAHGPRAPPAI